MCLFVVTGLLNKSFTTVFHNYCVITHFTTALQDHNYIGPNIPAHQQVFTVTLSPFPLCCSTLCSIPTMLLRSMLNTNYAAQLYAQYRLCCSTLLYAVIAQYRLSCSTMRKSLILLRIVNLFFNFYRYMMRSKQHQLVL